MLCDCVSGGVVRTALGGEGVFGAEITESAGSSPTIASRAEGTNRLTPGFFTPAIDLHGTIIVDPDRRTIGMNATIDVFPAFEVCLIG